MFGVYSNRGGDELIQEGSELILLDSENLPFLKRHSALQERNTSRAH